MQNNGTGAAQSPGARNADVQRPDGTPVRVLVVDDEPSLAELLASVLRYEGWNVLTAGSGAEAVRTARGRSGVPLPRTRLPKCWLARLRHDQAKHPRGRQSD